MNHHRRRRLLGLALAAPLVLAACAGTPTTTPVAVGDPTPSAPAVTTPASPPASPTVGPRPGDLPGMPPLLDPADVYAADQVGELAPAVRGVPERVYVPNSGSDSVDVIDPRTFKIIDNFPVGKLPQHVVPSYDLTTLWVNNNQGNTLTPLDPRTGKPGTPLPVDAPYNLYFTPDGKSAMIMAERLRRIDFRDPDTMLLQSSLAVPDCAGVNHADFSADGTFFLASCEFAGKMIKVDTAKRTLVGTLDLGAKMAPQDVRLTPDGTRFVSADMNAGGIHVIDPVRLVETSFVKTGRGAHGVYFSRDSKDMYVSNRDEGSVSVLDAATLEVRATWKISPTATPDMGGVSADGTQLWLSGRYRSEVYVLDTGTGALLATIKVGAGPHGLAFFPQPGRYSLGHTGTYR